MDLTCLERFDWEGAGGWQVFDECVKTKGVGCTHMCVVCLFRTLEVA